MDLISETILDVFTYKNKKILCQIKVESNSGKFKNCRRLSQEQWMVFDKNLEKLISIDDWNNEKCLKFNINPSILVKIQKSSLSLKHFSKCLGITADFDGECGEANYILECLFDFKREFLFSPSIDSQEFELHSETTLDCVPCSPLSYDPYTPTKKKYGTNKIDVVKTPGIDFLVCDGSTKETNGMLSTEVMQRSEWESKNKTLCLSENNQSENFRESMIDTEYKMESVQSGTSKDSSKSIESNDARKENAFITPEKDRSLKIESAQLSKMEESKNCCAAGETKRDMSSQTDNLKNSQDRSKYKDFLLELTDKIGKENHKSKRKKLKKDKSCIHTGNKKTSKLPSALDELPENFTQTKNSEQKNEIQNINKETHKKASELAGISSHPKKEKTPSSKRKNTPEKHQENLLTKNETKLNFTKEKNAPKTPPIGNDNAYESAIEMSPEKMPRRNRKLNSYNKDTAVLLRRSERSPSKPKRFIEEQRELLTKSKIKDKSCKMNELFGTDEDEDKLFETKKEVINSNNKKIKMPIFETPDSKKPVEYPSSSSSKKKKRKRDKSAECQQEKHGMSKWLSKKNSKTLNHESKTTLKPTPKSSPSKSLPLKALTHKNCGSPDGDSNLRPKSVTPPPMTIELPSKEELELMRNKTSLMRVENARMKAELDKMRTSPPKEVEILSLENIPEDKILSTFSTYKDELDEIFQNNRKRDYIKGHDGINHCFIIRLLQQSIQMKMLEKLTDVYGCSNTTRQATLFANALLPEWVIRVYMEEFNFTRQQAIDQIKAQEAFQLHMEEQNENSFEFD